MGSIMGVYIGMGSITGVYIGMGSIMGVYLGMGSITGVWLKAVGAFLGPNRGCREAAGNGGLHARPLAFQSFIWPKHCQINKPYLLWTEVCNFKFTCRIIHIKLYYKDRSAAPIIVWKCTNLLSMQHERKTNTTYVISRSMTRVDSYWLVQGLGGPTWPRKH